MLGRWLSLIRSHWSTVIGSLRSRLDYIQISFRFVLQHTVGIISTHEDRHHSLRQPDDPSQNQEWPIVALKDIRKFAQLIKKRQRNLPARNHSHRLDNISSISEKSNRKKKTSQIDKRPFISTRSLKQITHFIQVVVMSGTKEMEHTEGKAEKKRKRNTKDNGRRQLSRGLLKLDVVLLPVLSCPRALRSSAPAVVGV